MQFGVLNLVLCLATAVGSIAAGVYWRLATRRRAREQAEWAAMEASLRTLDMRLDQVWADDGPSRPD
jgi:hypothetical protein